ncbi:MAG: hypothetical protein WC675_02405 [Patescibacteria group bacterium]|jgi:hypothetical protein
MTTYSFGGVAKEKEPKQSCIEDVVARHRNGKGDQADLEAALKDLKTLCVFEPSLQEKTGPNKTLIVDVPLRRLTLEQLRAILIGNKAEIRFGFLWLGKLTISKKSVVYRRVRSLRH